MLTGQPVFSGETPVVTALAHVHNAPIPPRLRSEITIPSALDALIMECLAKDPAARPASTAVLGERLAATVLTHAWRPGAARTWWESHQPLGQPGPANRTAAVDDRTDHDLLRLRRGLALKGAAVRPVNAS